MRGRSAGVLLAVVIVGATLTATVLAWVSWQVPTPPARISAILSDVALWDSALDGERRDAAQRVEERMDGFSLEGLDTFSAGGRTHDVAIFSHARTGLEFVLIPAGTFLMGGAPEWEYPSVNATRHQVTLSKPFLLGRTECTQRAWDRVGGDDARTWRGESLPIEGVSWDDVTAWCRKARLRLPTEAEWEYACRAGTTTPFNLGEDITPEQVNFLRSSTVAGRETPARRKTTAAGRLSHNAFGLHDMHGNVWEWCEDVYVVHHPTSHVTDPLCTSGTRRRPFRGGGWLDYSWLLRSSSRIGDSPARRGSYVGFRPARSVPID